MRFVVRHRSVLVLALAGVCVLGATGSAAAQTYQPRPVVSPYILLGQQQGNNGAFQAGLQYYGNIRPQLNFYRGINQNQQQEATDRQALTQAINGLETPTVLPATGHTVGFQTQLRYFQTVGRPGVTVGAAQRGATQAAPAARTR
jgi:hypothetical protein